MKKLFVIFFMVVVSFFLLCSVAYAEGFDLSKLSDKELEDLFETVKTELMERGLKVSELITLREGKYIVGEDILPGTYKVTCISTEGETLNGFYSSLGRAYDQLGEDEGWGSLMGSFGGMMEELAPTVVEIVGDYGSVLKSFEMKKGDVVSITLTAKTALQISDGGCILEPNNA